ncbi:MULTISPECIES: CAT RNA binding domain-containing protein [Corynebacterium]|uniref:CAT RNA binding domain-containing protein n=1 Tax=Corynebacterium TaxID=1716 RepID=UPI001EF5F86F|nr:MULTISPECIES: CAT RNA binding domain-containing protein [Corynebacterium]
MKIVRVLNNNVVLATRDDGGEVVLTGGGVGFGMKAGQRVGTSLHSPMPRPQQ